MSWTYEQMTGNLTTPSGELIAKGYSGYPPAKNNPTAEDLHDFGPIPRGMWQIVELIEESTNHGPFVLRLESYAETQTFGRSGFLVHGDSSSHPGLASHGCIILSRDVRQTLWSSQDHDLSVI